MRGWPEQAPFDRISVTAAAETPPAALLDQLAVGGIMVMPVGGRERAQFLQQIRRTEDGYETHDLIEVRVVPLLPGLVVDNDA